MKRYLLILSVNIILVTSFIANAQCVSNPACEVGRFTDAAAGAFRSGIFRISIGTTVFTYGGATFGYLDNYCASNVSIFRSASTAISVNTGSNINENVRVYLDLNNDNVLDESSELIFSSNNRSRHNGSFVLPATSPTDVRLRLRVVSDRTTNANIAPCFTPEIGQGIDISVTAQLNILPPVANFSVVADSSTCNAEVEFQDISLNAPSTFMWYFGDGDSSISQNPVHVYDTAGVYTVRLRVSNQYGSSTKTRTNFIRYNGSDLVPTICQPATGNPCCSYGIRNLRFGSINTFGYPNTDSYQDFSCQARVKLRLGSNTLMRFQGGTLPQDSKVWIDFNNDGDFGDSSELVASVNNMVNPSFRIVIPYTATVGSLVRMRVGSDYLGSSFTECTGMTHGQYEDFGVYILENNAPPIALFEVQNSTQCTPQFIFSFIGSGSGRYLWDFGDGEVVNSTLATITHTYAHGGSYNVKLKVMNNFGQDSVSIQNAATYVSGIAQTICVASRTSFDNNFNISRFRLSNLDLLSMANGAPYYNNTCSKSANVMAGNYVFSIFCAGNNNYAALYVDWDNNGSFDEPNSLVYSSTLTAFQHSANLVVPRNLLPDVPLRIRVIASDSYITTSCPDNLGNFIGQVQDYTLMLLPSLARPVAKIGIVPSASCYSSRDFIDSSSNRPTFRKWTIFNSLNQVVANSWDANPTFSFSSAGLYSVKLVVSNAYGADSVRLTNYITVTNGNGLRRPNCVPAYSNNFSSSFLTSVSFLNVSRFSSLSSEKYVDNSCDFVGQATRGGVININSVTNNNFDPVTCFIDWNGDAVFDVRTERYNLTSNQTGVADRILIPVNASGSRVRMRFIVYASSSCSSIQDGETEDYALDFESPRSRPTAFAKVLSIDNCSGVVSFQDSSYNVPSMYLLNFGDNSTSTDVNPVHRYDVGGNYVVSLIVRNSVGADTFYFANRLSLILANGPRQANCIPSTIFPNNGLNVGILRVQFGSIDRTSNLPDVEGTYKNFACVDTTRLIRQSNYRLTVTTSGNREIVYGWIDWNNDGLLANDELIFNQQGSGDLTEVISVPSNAVLNRFLRLRLTDDYYSSSLNNSCYGGQYGQTEDYGVMVLNNTVTDLKRVNNLKVYPNPSNDGLFTVTGLEQLGEEARIHIFASNGVELQSESQIIASDGSLKIAIQNFSSGVYIAKINTPNSVSFLRIIKN